MLQLRLFVGGTSPWLEQKTTYGHIYYYNSESGETQWTKPNDFNNNSRLLTKEEIQVRFTFVSLSASCLRPVCVLSASSLRPVCVSLSASSLRPLCVLSASSLRPLCVLSASSLRPVCVSLSASSLRPLCVLSASSLRPLCLLSVFLILLLWYFLVRNIPGDRQT